MLCLSEKIAGFIYKKSKLNNVVDIEVKESENSHNFCQIIRIYFEDNGMCSIDDQLQELTLLDEALGLYLNEVPESK